MMLCAHGHVCRHLCFHYAHVTLHAFLHCITKKKLNVPPLSPHYCSVCICLHLSCTASKPNLPFFRIVSNLHCAYITSLQYISSIYCTIVCVIFDSNLSLDNQCSMVENHSTFSWGQQLKWVSNVRNFSMFCYLFLSNFTTAAVYLVSYKSLRCLHKQIAYILKEKQSACSNLLFTGNKMGGHGGPQQHKNTITTY